MVFFSGWGPGPTPSDLPHGPRWKSIAPFWLRKQFRSGPPPPVVASWSQVSGESLDPRRFRWTDFLGWLVKYDSSWSVRYLDVKEVRKWMDQWWTDQWVISAAYKWDILGLFHPLIRSHLILTSWDVLVDIQIRGVVWGTITFRYSTCVDLCWYYYICILSREIYVYLL